MRVHIYKDICERIIRIYMSAYTSTPVESPESEPVEGKYSLSSLSLVTLLCFVGLKKFPIPAANFSR